MVYVHNLDSVLFSLFGFSVKWYSLMVIVGYVLAFFVIRHLAKVKRIELSNGDLYDLTLYMILGMFIGARIFHVMFYEFDVFLQDPLMLFRVWNGGLKFFGAFFGVIGAVYLFCKVKKRDFLELADLCVVPVGSGIVFGRIGNFMNAEVVGRVTSVPWAVDFGDGMWRHPYQIYGMIKGSFIFTCLWFLNHKNLPKGTVFFSFMLIYAGIRFFIEFFREPAPQVGFVLFDFLTLGQVTSVLIIVVGVVGLWKLGKK